MRESQGFFRSPRASRRIELPRLPTKREPRTTDGRCKSALETRDRHDESLTASKHHQYPHISLSLSLSLSLCLALSFTSCDACSLYSHRWISTNITNVASLQTHKIHPTRCCYLNVPKSHENKFTREI